MASRKPISKSPLRAVVGRDLGPEIRFHSTEARVRVRWEPTTCINPASFFGLPILAYALSLSASDGRRFRRSSRLVPKQRKAGERS
ncbi:hypothetical protein L209DRAFT_747543 [Thermothelomyces heterothallicus CBS 203.75]